MKKENVGYRIIKEEVYDITMLQGEIIAEKGICIGYNSRKKEYVTWSYVTHLQSLETQYYHGHYTTDKQKALIDYHERLHNIYYDYELDIPPFEEEVQS